MRHIPSSQDETDAAYNPVSRDWTVFQESVRKIGEFAFAETQHKPLVIGVFNNVKNAKKELKYWPARKTFETSGFDWIDLGDEFRIEPVPRFEGHPNREITHVSQTPSSKKLSIWEQSTTSEDRVWRHLVLLKSVQTLQGR